MLTFQYLIYLSERALPLAHTFLNFSLSLSNRIGRLAKTPKAIKEKESVVNLAMPQCDEAKARIDSCINKSIYILNNINLNVMN